MVYKWYKIDTFVIKLKFKSNIKEIITSNRDKLQS